MKKERAIIIISVGFISLLFLLWTVSQAFSVPLFAPIVITFGDSYEEQKSTETVLNLYPNSIVMKFDDIKSILNILTIGRSYSQLILIGHGTEAGILSSKGIIAWQSIAHWVNSLPNTQVYFLSCNSFEASKLINAPSLGFQGEVDGPLAAYAIAIKDNQYHHVALDSNLAITKFNERFKQLYYGSESESMSIICMGCGGTPPPPTYTVTFVINFSDISYWYPMYSWTVNFNGQTKSSITPIIQFSGVSGSSSHSYSVSTTNPRYSISPSSGSVYVGSANTGATISFNIKALSIKSSIPTINGGTIDTYCVIQPSDPLYSSINLPSYVFGCVGLEEIAFWTMNLLVLALLVFFDLVLSTGWDIMEKVGLSLAALHVPVIYTLYLIGHGDVGVGTLFDQISLFMLDGLSLIYNGFLSADLATKALLLGSGVIAVVLNIIEYGTDWITASGAVTIAKWTSAALSILGLGYGLVRDYLDTNTEP